MFIGIFLTTLAITLLVIKELYYPKYVYVFPVTGDIFEFRHEFEGKTGLINVSNGKVIVDATYEDIECDIIGEVCKTKLNDKYGIIDLNGNVLVNNIYDNMNFNSNLSFVGKDQKLIIIDLKDGNTLVIDPYDAMDFNSYLFIVEKDQKYSLKGIQF